MILKKSNDFNHYIPPVYQIILQIQIPAWVLYAEIVAQMLIGDQRGWALFILGGKRAMVTPGT